ILPLSASLAAWPLLTARASSMPAATSAWSTSLRTTGIPAAAIVWAIWPPIVPAPTTAALNTNMLCRSPLYLLGGFPGAEPIARRRKRARRRIHWPVGGLTLIHTTRAKLDASAPAAAGGQAAGGGG